MTPNQEKELRNHLKTLDKDQLIELLVQFKYDAELLQGVANDVLDAMNEKLVLEKALELMSISFFGNVKCIYFPATETKIESNVALYDYFIQKAKESLK